MDAGSKNSIYNNSTYAQWQAQKLAMYETSRYGSTATTGTSGSTSSTGMTYYNLSDGKILARPSESKYVNFKSLFSFLDEDNTYDSSTGSYTGLGNYQSISDSLFSAYEKRAKQNLNLD